MADNTDYVARDWMLTYSRREGIDDSPHWRLDMSFGEDQSRARKDHASANLAVLRRMSWSLLKNETSEKVGVENSRLVASWNTDYPYKVLSR